MCKFIEVEKKPLTHINGIEIYRRRIEDLPKNKDLLARSRSLRKGYILSEVIFWKHVRNGNFHGLDFDRQRIIGNYIVDFYLKSVGLVIEIDGASHELKDEYDDKRQKYLEGLDLIFYRISDLRIKHDLANVMRELEDFIIQNFS